MSTTDAMARLMQSVETTEKLRTISNGVLADLLQEHIWADCQLDSARSALVGEVMDRLRGTKTCPACCGYGYKQHIRCAECDGTGDVPGPRP